MPRIDPSHIPLNVKTYREGFLVLRGWTCVSILSFITGALLVTYELLVMNVEDRDFRDMLFDYRVTQPGIMYHHKRFINSQYCCNHDPLVFGYTCNEQDMQAEYFSAPQAWYAKQFPYCPPVMRFTCASLSSPQCFQTRAAVYAAAGLDPRTGAPVNCGRAGRVRLRAEWDPSSMSSSKLSVEWRGQWQPEQMIIADNSAVDLQGLSAFFDGVAQRYSDPLYTTPQAPLSRSLSLQGTKVGLTTAVAPGHWDNNNFGWPFELWPWPPGWGCANTGRPPALYMTGSPTLDFAPYNASDPPTATFGFFGDEVTLPQYRIERLGVEEVEAAAAAAVGSNGSSSGGSSVTLSLPEAAMESAEAAPGVNFVALKALNSIVLRAGLVPVMDACNAWMLDKDWVDASYSVIWQGTRTALQQLLAINSSAPFAGSQTISVELRDVSEPLPLALPRYAGNIYIYAALVMGAIWMFSTVPLLAMFVVVLIHVQRNQGLPLFIYKYMRKYRGW